MGNLQTYNKLFTKATTQWHPPPRLTTRTPRTKFLFLLQICPRLNANGIQIPCDKHRKVSSLVKSHLSTNMYNSVKYEVVLIKISNNPLKYEVLIKQYLRSILDISVNLSRRTVSAVIKLSQAVADSWTRCEFLVSKWSKHPRQYWMPVVKRRLQRIKAELANSKQRFSSSDAELGNTDSVLEICDCGNEIHKLWIAVESINSQLKFPAKHVSTFEHELNQYKLN